MAPTKGLRTYANKSKKPASKLALDNLLANNIRKRLELSINSPGTSRDSTFDRLLKGEVYNNVVLKKFPDNNFNTYEDSASSLFSKTDNSVVNENKNELSSKSSPVVNNKKIKVRKHTRSVGDSHNDSNNISNSEGTRITNSCNGSQESGKILTNNSRKQIEISIDSPGTSNNEPSGSTFSRLLKENIYNNDELSINNFNSNGESVNSLYERTENINNESKRNELNKELSSKLYPMVILERNLENSPEFLGFKRISETSRCDNSEKESNTINSSGTGIVNNHNGSHQLEREDSLLMESYDCRKMILMESLQLNRSPNDAYLNFRNSIDKVSTPRSRGNIYFLRRHLRNKTQNAQHLTNLGCSNGEIDSSHPKRPSQLLREELSGRNGSILDNHSDVQKTSIIASCGEAEVNEIISEAEEFIEHPVTNSSSLLSETPQHHSESLLSESLEIIDQWSNKCPTPNSFGNNFQSSAKYNNVSQGSRKLNKRKTDAKLFKKSKVVLKHSSHLEKIVKENFKTMTPHDLKILKVKNLSNVSRRKRKSLKRNPTILKDCAIYLTPLNMKKLKPSVRSPDMIDISSDKSSSQLFESQKSPNTNSNHKLPPSTFLRFSEAGISESPIKERIESEEKCSFIHLKKSSSRSRMKHKCSDKCEHFRKIPTVILQRCSFSKYTSNRLIDINDDCGSCITNSLESVDSVDASKRRLRTSDHDLHDNCKTNDVHSGKIIETKSVQFQIKDCFVNVERMKIPRKSDKTNLLPKKKKTANNLKECRIILNMDELNTETHSLKNGSSPHKHLSEASFHKQNSFERICLPKSQSLIEENDTFRTPLKIREFVSLAPGKKFRRSIAVFKRNLDDSGRSPFTSRITLHRRQSVKLVSVLQNKSKISDLASIALNNSGYVSLRQSFRRSSLEKVENCSPNDQPVEDYRNYINENTADQLTARDIVLKRCGQTEPLQFEKCYPTSALRHCQKIGEGVFGEVFMLRDKDGSTTVMKVIPIEGEQIVNLEKQKTFEEIISEIIISMELSNLEKTKRNNTNAFVKVKGVRCVQGCYPNRLLELWDLYDENKTSENDSPQIFLEDQLYIVIELANAGQDLEAFQFNNAQQAVAIFEQITCALAVAESQLQFEHRDLHWGNVLITHTEQKNSVFILDGKEIIVNNRGAKATIIDFTLSRVEYDGVIIFNDLSMDEDLFTAKGDYQFDIYRKMQENNGNQWQSFKPFSNILWLHYILDKALKGFRYKNTKSKVHKSSMDILRAYEQKILESNSATEFVLNNFISNILIE